MKKFTLLMAAAVSLLLISCNKDNDYANSILGTWEGYLRSSIITKGGKAVSAETYMNDLIACGELEAPENDEERAELIKEIEEDLRYEYYMKGDEDITLTFEKDGKATSVYIDEEPVSQTMSYSISKGQLILSDGSHSQTMNIEKIDSKEMILGFENTHSYRVSDALTKLGYSTYECVTFVKK